MRFYGFSVFISSIFRHFYFAVRSIFTICPLAFWPDCLRVGVPVRYLCRLTVEQTTDSNQIVDFDQTIDFVPYLGTIYHPLTKLPLIDRGYPETKRRENAREGDQFSAIQWRSQPSWPLRVPFLTLRSLYLVRAVNAGSPYWAFHLAVLFTFPIF